MKGLCSLIFVRLCLCSAKLFAHLLNLILLTTKFAVSPAYLGSSCTPIIYNWAVPLCLLCTKTLITQLLAHLSHISSSLVLLSD